MSISRIHQRPSTRRPRRLLSIAHAYSVSLSRRLANEMARAGEGRWEVTAVAPNLFYENYRPVRLNIERDEVCAVRPVRLHLPRHIHLMFYGREVRDLLRQTWDLIHCWEEPFNIAGAQVAWQAPKNVPFVFWTAQNISKRYPPPFAQFENFTLDRCDGWLACGQSIIDTMLPRGYGRKPYRVAPLGVDVAHFKPMPAARGRMLGKVGWTEDGSPIVGYLGRLVEEKGIRLLCRALESTASAWRLLVVGNGPLERMLRQWAARYEHRVRIVTDVAHDEVPAWLNAMDLLAVPSQTTPRWREQFGRVLIEAFACGVPLVASDSGEIPHVVQEAGLIVGETDRRGWTTALDRLLLDPSLRANLRASGLDRVHANYAWPIIARRHLQFFEELIDLRKDRESGGLGGAAESEGTQ